MIRLAGKHRYPALVLALSFGLSAGPLPAQTYQNATADQVMRDAETLSLTDPKAGCDLFIQAANLYRAAAQQAAREGNATSKSAGATPGADPVPAANEALRGELTARNRASQVCNLAAQTPPRPAKKP